MHVHCRAFTLLLFAGAMGCGQGTPDIQIADDRPDQQRIQGSWTVVSGERFEKPMPEPVGQVWTFGKDTVNFSKDDWSQETTFVLHPDESPKGIELGPRGNPRSQAGLYSIDGNRLRLCLDHWDDPRPSDFTTAELENRMILELERMD
jgi:uncharacterized protein (TIGR03067 family)